MTLDLHTDQAKLRRYVQQRIDDYASTPNIGPGSPTDPIRLVTFGYYVEQGGYVNLVFDTRADAQIDGKWTLYIGHEKNTLPFPEWLAAYHALWDGQEVSVVRHDGTKSTLLPSDAGDGANRVFGETIADLMRQLRDDGSFQKLPLASDALMNLEEFDGRYAWPLNAALHMEGRIGR